MTFAQTERDHGRCARGDRPAYLLDPYLRSPISDDWSWSEMRPFIQELVDKRLTAGGPAVRRWGEVSEDASRALGMGGDGSMSSTEAARVLSDVGTHLMNVLVLVDAELSR